MNKLANLVACALLALILGCATAEKNALVTIGTVGTAADAAIGAYHQYILTHPVSPAQVRDVRRAVQAYTLAVNTARLAVTSYKSGALDRAALDQAIDALSVSSAEIVKLINLLTQSSQPIPAEPDTLFLKPTLTPNPNP